MGIIGFSFREINAKVSGKTLPRNLEIRSAPKVDNLRVEDFTHQGIGNVVVMDFSFKTTYGTTGEIAVAGDIVYQTEDPEGIVNLWKDKQKMEKNITMEVMNTIFRRCLSRVVQLADDLRLPPPVTFPTVIDKETAEKKEAEAKKKKK